MKKVIIIGAGPGGYETALEAAGMGMEVVLIESGEVGGTCLNAGCIPTKALCRSAELLEEMRSADDFGVVIGNGFNGSDYGPSGVDIDFQKVIARKDGIVRSLRENVEALLTNPLIRIVRGRASFKDARTVIVTYRGESCDSAEDVSPAGSGASVEEYTADYIIIATGSVSAMLSVPGADLPGVVTSKEILSLESVPRRLCIIGAGVIGLEFASVFRSFGSEVSVVEYCREAIPRFDADIAKRLRQSLSKRGITFNMQSEVVSMTASSEGIKVDFIRKGKEDSIIADKVLVAVGRVPNIASLGLGAAGIEYTKKGIVTDGNMMTNVPGVYAIGDAAGGYMLAHAAIFQGKRALNHICGISDDIRPDVVPAVVFTKPEAASVGLTEEECTGRGISYTVKKAFFRSNGKAVCLGETEGICKMIVAEDGHILGCHILGPHSADLIHEITVCITGGMTLSHLKNTVHAHPTLSEVFLAL